MTDSDTNDPRNKSPRNRNPDPTLITHPPQRSLGIVGVRLRTSTLHCRDFRGYFTCLTAAPNRYDETLIVNESRSRLQSMVLNITPVESP